MSSAVTTFPEALNQTGFPALFVRAAPVITGRTTWFRRNHEEQNRVRGRCCTQCSDLNLDPDCSSSYSFGAPVSRTALISVVNEQEADQNRASVSDR